MELIRPDDYDNISNQVRQQCTQKLIGMEEALRPYVNGDFGDINPGHVVAYVNIIKELGRLWGGQKPPRQEDKRIPVAQVEQMMLEAQKRQEDAVAAAVADAEARMRQEQQEASAMSIESAKAAVLALMKALTAAEETK